MRRAAMPLLAAALLAAPPVRCEKLKAKQAFLNRDEAAKLGFSIPPEIADPPQKGAGGKPRRPRKSAKNKLRSRAQKLLQADGEADGDPAAEEHVASLAHLLPAESELASRAARAQLLETAGAMYVANQSAWGALALGLSHGSPLAPLLFGINASAPLPGGASDLELLRFAANSAGTAGELARLALGWRHLTGEGGVEGDCHLAVSEYYLRVALASVRAADEASSSLRATDFPFVEEVWLWEDWLRGWSRQRQSALKVAAIQAQADNNDTASTLAMAEMLWFGDNPAVPLDEDKALEYYRRGAEQGSGRAAHNLAIILQKGGGGGGAEDVAEAAEMLGKAVARGHNAAMTELGKQLMADGEEATAAEGLKLVELGAASGDADGHHMLFRHHREAGNISAALAHLEEAASVAEPYTTVSLLAHFSLGEAHWRRHSSLRQGADEMRQNASAGEATIRQAEAEAQAECMVAAEHLKYVAEGGVAGGALQDAYWAHWDEKPLASLIGYAWGGSLGYDIAQAALSELLNEPRSRQLLGCGEPGLGGTTGPCERARWAVLRRLVSTRAREGDTLEPATSAAVGRRLPVEALAALAEAALEVAGSPQMAFELYGRAAQRGNPQSMLALAALYEGGVPGVTEPNATMVIELCELALARLDGDWTLKARAQSLRGRNVAKYWLGSFWWVAALVVLAAAIVLAWRCCCSGGAEREKRE